MGNLLINARSQGRGIFSFVILGALKTGVRPDIGEKRHGPYKELGLFLWGS